MLAEHIFHLIPVFSAYLILIASPGPSIMAIMGTAMRQGRPPAVALALGVVTGSLFWAILAASGVSTVLAAYAEAIFVIKIAGGLYLLYLAWKSARSAMAAQARPATSLPPVGLWASYRKGVLLHLSNPKAILGWIAIMSLGLQPDAPSDTIPIILSGCAVLTLTVNLGYAVLFSTGAMERAYRKARRWIEGLLAVVFGYGGLRLLLSKL